VKGGENQPLREVAHYGCYTNVAGTGGRGEAVLDPVHLAAARRKVTRYLRAEPSSMLAFARVTAATHGYGVPKRRATAIARVAYTGKTVLGSTRQARGLSPSACNVSAVDRWKRVRID
jgi:hypothetical protein